MSMKVSVSLPDNDVEYLDAYATAQGFASRSAVLHKAVRLLRASELGSAYEDAWDDWDASGCWLVAPWERWEFWDRWESSPPREAPPNIFSSSAVISVV